MQKSTDLQEIFRFVSCVDPTLTASSLLMDSDRLVGVVCCPKTVSTYSLTGSNIIASLIASSLLGIPRIERDWLEIARQHTLSNVEALAYSMRGEDFGRYSSIGRDLRPSFDSIIEDYFLCSIVVAIVTPSTSHFFSIGEGYIEANGKHVQVGPFADGEKPYLFVALMDSQKEHCASCCLKFQERHFLPTEGLHSFSIGDESGKNFLAFFRN